MPESSEPTIGAYEPLPAAYRKPDHRAAEVARWVARAICAEISGVEVEHVGSTSVSGCGGEGIVDLAILAPAERHSDVASALDRLGFRPVVRNAEGAVRPLRSGSVRHADEVFRLHVYLFAPDAPEVDRLQFFRTCLRADPDLLKAYMACKRSIISGGTTDPAGYDRAKGAFIDEVLR